MELLKIIGTSHIAKQSIEEIRKAVEEFQPEIIAVELDAERAASLFREEKRKMSLRDITSIGFRGYLFARIGQYVQQKMGKSVGIAPGSEMKTAIELAQKNKLQIALIDQPIQITLRNFSKELTWKEKGRFVWELITGIFTPKKQIKKYGLENFDLKKVPEQAAIDKIIHQLQLQYPSIYKTLITDRNKYMVRRLVRLMKQFPEKKVLAIVGAGHKEGMEKLLEKVDIVR